MTGVIGSSANGSTYTAVSYTHLDNSFEALSWFREAASAGGIEVNPDEPQADRVLHINGYDVYLHANTYFRIGHDEVVKAITPIAESAGVEFFFSCPAQQLVTADVYQRQS